MVRLVQDVTRLGDAGIAASTGDPVTPLVLQKLQPVLAVLAAYFILGERLRHGCGPWT
jgi:drug/metabolite transporter (DMT)-like permease